MKIFSGTANKPLAHSIASHFNVSLSKLDMHIFPDGEKRIRVVDSVVDKDCIIVQPTAMPVDSNYMELFLEIDALKRSGARSITAVVAYLGYQRQDHVFREGEAVSLRVMINLLEAAGATKVVSLDLHSIKIPQLFKIPIIHLSALPLFAKKISELDSKNSLLVSPDMGGIRRIKQLSKLLDGMEFIAIEKDRDLISGQIEAKRIETEGREVQLSGKTAFMVDDMISSGWTIAKASELLKKKDVSEIFVFATHPVFSENAAQILEHAAVEKVFVTDTIQVPKQKILPKLEILSVGEMIAKSLL